MAPLQNTETELVIADLQALIGPKRWAVWFEGATDIHISDSAVTVGVANLFISDYIRSHFADALARVVRGRLGRDLPIGFRVQPDLFQRRRAANLDDEVAAEDQLASGAAASGASPANGPPAGERRPLFTLDNFVVGPCNQMAYAAAKAAAAAPGADFHPLFIHGACGLGKTHLLHGVLHALRQRGNLRIALLSAEQFTNRYLAGMRTHSLDAFRHRYRNLDVLAIDDIHFLAGKPSTQEEFLHTFNEFDGRGRLVILASDAHPREMAAIEDRLVSRWVAGLVVRLSHPDAETRRRILAAKTVSIGRPMPDDVLAFIAGHVQGSVRELEGALTRIVAYAALLKHPVTMDLARQAMAELGPSRPTRAGLKEIEATVAEFFGVGVSDVQSARKNRIVSLARQVTMVLGREMTDLSYSEIARLLGNKNHTTVLAACRKWQKLVAQSAEIVWSDRTDSRSMSAGTLLAHLKERIRR